ncbi:MAG: hypothetical protein ACKO37_01255 [Vampirovibrionales bacterium]
MPYRSELSYASRLTSASHGENLYTEKDLSPPRKGEGLVHRLSHWLTDAFLTLHQQVTVPKHYEGTPTYQVTDMPLPSHWHLLVPKAPMVSAPILPTSLHVSAEAGPTWEELALLLKTHQLPSIPVYFQQVPTDTTTQAYTQKRQDSHKLVHYWLEHVDALQAVYFHEPGSQYQQDMLAWPFCFDWIHAIHRRFPQATQHLTVHVDHLLHRLPELLKAPPLQLDIYIEGVTPSHYKIQTGKTYREVQKTFQPLWIKLTHFMQLWHKAHQHYALKSAGTRIRLVTPVTQVSIQQYQSIIQQAETLGVHGLVFHNTVYPQAEMRQVHTLLKQDTKVRELLAHVEKAQTPLLITLPVLESTHPRTVRHCEAVCVSSQALPLEAFINQVAMDVSTGSLSPCAMGRLFVKHQEVKFWHSEWYTHYTFQWLASIYHHKPEAETQEVPSQCKGCPYNRIT